MDKKKILLVDDEEDFCFFVKENLERTGEFEVCVVTKGKDALSIATQENPDLILLDILMPGISGPEIAEGLLKDPKTKNTPLIFLTAVVSKEEIGVEFLKKIGGCMFIAKPVDTERLAHSIKTVLGKRYTA